MSKTIFWIHGWGTSSEIWAHNGLTVRLAEELEGYRHEYADLSACLRPADFYHAVSQQLLSCNEERYIIIGWSLGAMLALQALMDGELRAKIDSVVVVSGTLHFVDSNRLLGWPDKIVARMRKKLAENEQAVLESFRLSMLAPEELNLDWAKPVVQGPADFNLEGLDAGLSYLQETDLRSSWEEYISSSYRRPLLWIHGAKDLICPAGAIPESPAMTCVLLDGAGHVPFLSHRELFYKHLRGFIHDGAEFSEKPTTIE